MDELGQVAISPNRARVLSGELGSKRAIIAKRAGDGSGGVVMVAFKSSRTRRAGRLTNAGVVCAKRADHGSASAHRTVVSLGAESTNITVRRGRGLGRVQAVEARVAEAIGGKKTSRRAVVAGRASETILDLRIARHVRIGPLGARNRSAAAGGTIATRGTDHLVGDIRASRASEAGLARARWSCQSSTTAVRAGGAKCAVGGGSELGRGAIAANGARVTHIEVSSSRAIVAKRARAGVVGQVIHAIKTSWALQADHLSGDVLVGPRWALGGDSTACRARVARGARSNGGGGGARRTVVPSLAIAGDGAKTSSRAVRACRAVDTDSGGDTPHGG